MIGDIPGVGLLTQTAWVATMGDPKTFKSGREFAAFLGLVSRQQGTSGHLQWGHSSQRGDTTPRGLVIPGARSVLVNAEEKGT
ncbi:MAG: transposase [Acidiferrobacter sp.]